MGNDRTYLDHNASSPLRPEARAAMFAAQDRCGNASSVHAEGRAARNLLEAAREDIAALLGVKPRMVVFTSGGTEANVLALRGASAERIVVSAIEHPSVRWAAEQSGRPVESFKVDPSGVADLESLQLSLSRGEGSRTSVSLMAANNETGALQPVAEAGELTHAAGGLLHCDAAQAVGRMPVDWHTLGVDLMSLSAHKFGGPQGVGVLLVGTDMALAPLIGGGGQELHRRGGTENVAAICGMAAAIRAALGNRDDAVRRLRDRFEAGLRIITPGVRIFAEEVPRLANTSCFALDGLAAETALIALDLDGVAVSSGSACSSGKVGASHVLQAMGVGPGLARSALRVSLGWTTTEDDVETALEAWHALTSRSAARSAA